MMWLAGEMYERLEALDAATGVQPQTRTLTLVTDASLQTAERGAMARYARKAEQVAAGATEANTQSQFRWTWTGEDWALEYELAQRDWRWVL